MVVSPRKFEPDIFPFGIARFIQFFPVGSACAPKDCTFGMESPAVCRGVVMKRMEPYFEGIAEPQPEAVAMRQRGMSALGHTDRFCDVSFSVRYPQYRTLSPPIGAGLPGSFLC